MKDYAEGKLDSLCAEFKDFKDEVRADNMVIKGDIKTLLGKVAYIYGTSAGISIVLTTVVTILVKYLTGIK